MEETRILSAQVDALLENLVHARHAFGSDKIDNDLREAVRHRFGWLDLEMERELQALKEEIDRGEVTADSWKDFAVLRHQFDCHFRECLAFLEGALMRSAGLDHNVCKVADALLGPLSRQADCPWQRFTIMADKDLFVGMSEIIRLQFPGLSIWHLPIVVHELGHYVAEILNEKTSLFSELMKEEDFVTSDELHEQFADYFAVNALGPAFACSCIFLHFTPTFQGAGGHLPDNERVHFILKSLSIVDGPNKYYRQVKDKLKSLWQFSMQTAKKQDSMSPEQTMRHDKRLEKFRTYPGVGARLEYIRYKSWPNACILSGNSLNPSGLKVPLRDVINAAWHWRLWNPDEQFMHVEQAALDLCLNIMESEPFEV